MVSGTSSDVVKSWCSSYENIGNTLWCFAEMEVPFIDLVTSVPVTHNEDLGVGEGTWKTEACPSGYKLRD